LDVHILVYGWIHQKARCTVRAVSIGIAPCLLALFMASCSGSGSLGNNGLAITTTSLPSGAGGVAYSQVLAASGGTPPYNWVVSSGNLPSGLTLASNGTISGTPASAQSSSFTVKVTDSSSPAQSASSPLSISITSGSILSITTTSLPPGIVGSSYSSALAASGGTTPYSWVVSSGSLPSGLTLASNGTISGTPASAQSSSFTVKVTDSSSPAQSASSLLSISIASGVTATPGATATQYVMSYTAANSSQCMLEVSTSPTYNPLVHAIDPTIFANANFDSQTNAGSRAFVVGQKWIAQENVAPPMITVGAASRGASSKLVTVNYTSQPFVVGDNITITGMSNSAYNDPWARVEVASANSFSYEVLTAASAGGDTSGGGMVIRANRYSLALATDTTYYYRLGSASNTCGASPATGTFTTMNIPNGNTWEEGVVRDNNGNQIEPTILELRTASFVDPLTGGQIQRVSLFSDGGASARGWSSSFYRSCSLSTSSNSFYHCVVGLGDSGTGGLYSIKSTGETHWLGLMKHNYTDSNGHACCQQAVNPYVNADSSVGDTSNANLFYGIQATNAGYSPSKNVVVSTAFTGNDAVDAASGANWASGTSTALTPDPSNTLDDKMAAFASSDTNYSIARFHGCKAVESYGNYLTGFCNSFDQGSPSIIFAFNISTDAVVAMGPIHENPQTRWCGSHGTVVDESSKWIGFGSAYLIGNQTGEWHIQLSSPVTSGATSFSVTSPQRLAGTAYSNSAAAGTTVVDSNNNLEVATTPGTSGSAQPTWNATSGGTTSDGTVTWTNAGAASHVGEPQNIYAFQDSNNNYWSFLMPAAGGTGGGGQFNGDLFHFEDGTNECVRLVTKGSVSGGVATWSSVTRAVNGNGLVGCSATASAHAAGASLRCLCEEGTEAQALSGHYWDFIDDAHMTDTTNTTYVRQNTSAGHGYAREPAPHGGTWVTFASFDQHNPFITADFTGNPTLIDQTQLTFNGLTTTPSGVAHQDYTTWNFDNASFKNSAVGSLFFVTGGGTGGYGTFTAVGGTTTIYKYALGTVPFSYTLPYVPTSGGNTLPDISGPGSLLADTGSNQVCVTVVAGECWTGSSPGDMYASLSQPVANLFCNNGGENNSFLGHDWCMMNTSTYGDALNQYGLVPADFLGNNSHGIPQYGAGLSRRLAQNALGGMRLQNLHPHTVPDGSAALFESCAADPHLALNGASVDSYGCQVFADLIPPQPPADGIDRTNYENVTVTIGAGSGGATHARVKYGYEENEPKRGTTWPPSIHFYCTQYQGTCYSSDQNLPLNSQQVLQIGVPQRVLFYEVEYLNASNQVVASDPITTVAIP
jgi:hypothetical protein